MKAGPQLYCGVCSPRGVLGMFSVPFHRHIGRSDVEVTSTAAVNQCIDVRNVWNRLFCETVQMDSDNTNIPF